MGSGWSLQCSGTMYFLPSGIRRIGSGNVHCVLCVLVGLKKVMDNILFSIKIENRWNGKNTPLESSFLVKDFFMVEYHLCQYAVRK